MYQKIKKYWMLIAAAVYVMIGCVIFQDYGISTDEFIERQSLLVNVNYILGKFGYVWNPLLEFTNFKNRFYGVVMYFPMMFFEALFDETHIIMICRHFYNFLVCVTGYGFFFVLANKLLKDSKLAMLGTAMLALYPRFFAQQFYNCKDMFFVAVFIVAMWATYMLIEKEFKFLWCVIFSFVTALATNVRYVGIIFLILMVGYLLISAFLRELTLKKFITTAAIVTALYIIFLILMCPATWENPLGTVFSIFNPGSYAVGWNGDLVFMGQVIRKEEIPWFYIPVWMLVTLPIWYIILFLASAISSLQFIYGVVKHKTMDFKIFFFKYKYILMCIGLFIPWGIVAVTKATIYNDWRHCYFLLPPVVLLILYGIKRISVSAACKKLITVITFLGLVSQVSWMLENHPYEMVYFNPIGRQFATGFDRDYWDLSRLQAFEWLCENEWKDASKEEIITLDNSCIGFIAFLEEERSKNLQVSDDPMYIMEDFYGIAGNEATHDGYEEIYAIRVDNYKIISVFKKLTSEK